VTKKTKRVDPGRATEVYQLLCTGLNRAAIIAYAKENDWAATESMIDQLLEGSIARLADAAAVSFDAELGKSIERLNRLFQECMKIQDHKTALQVQKEINKILQLKASREKNSQPQTARTPGKIRLVG
jgi:hypothetical protein